MKCLEHCKSWAKQNLKWILIGIGGIFLLFVILVIILNVYRRNQIQVGLNSEQIEVRDSGSEEAQMTESEFQNTGEVSLELDDTETEVSENLIAEEGQIGSSQTADAQGGKTQDSKAESGKNPTGNSSSENSSVADEQGSRENIGPNVSGSPAQEQVSAGWKFYESTSHSLLTSEQVYAVDQLVSNWTNGSCTDDELGQQLIDYLITSQGYVVGSDIWDISVMGNSKYLYAGLNAIPDYHTMNTNSNDIYIFDAVYTNGEWDGNGYLICYEWQVAIY